ncbi:Maltooligosyl trehalose synthase [Legionella wadsworthii]|uniref:Maltooligosyl trehalose synthase n=1 Tax=Legionella wadsworthii TaxID=28088 RepID=A0A378LZY6_9GAMM|nr:malto-oligosyltrehalose synthase [Legionella wadsworthii]STY29631.1 Maltooligosyl trehalose synthase [Legionella wadsworthii]
MHVPLSTYRIQLNKNFTLTQAATLVPYFKNLGISDLYLSPILQAQPGSLHGYDVTNPKQINSEIGGIEALRQLGHEVKKAGMGLCLDIVPNHMAATSHNAYWQDTLNQGVKSAYSDLFDIKWDISSKTKLVYRRFFDINELVCLRTENEKVFDWAHQFIFQLIQEELISGLRIDHIDGLREPLHYLKKLNNEIGKPFYIIAEKILGYDEKLPDMWPLSGTTGYDFLNEVNQIYIYPFGLSSINHFYDHAISNKETIKEIKIKCLKLVIQVLFKNEFDRLCQQLQNLLNARVDDLLLQFSSLMPVYRMYQEKDSIPFNKEIVEHITGQMNFADKNLLNLFKSLLLEEYPESFDEEKKQQWDHWRNDWEVFTGPVMAKGFEDTTCYNYFALLSVNEVGSAPQYFVSGGNTEKFHQYNQYKQQNFPYSLNTTSTHDTKRSEDVRARINVLSELYQEWNGLLTDWMQLNKAKKTSLNNKACPDVVDELLIYQSMLGIWPLSGTINIEERMKTFLVKAFRERKQNSSWINPNEDYENNAIRFMKNIIDDPQFMSSFLKFQNKVAFFGMFNSLSQLILKMTCPGIPDIYQGNETWCYHLVDPDNREMVHYQTLSKLHSEEPLINLINTWKDGRIKFNLTKQILFLRQQFKDIFLSGAYFPLEAKGQKSKHILSFIKKYNNEWIAVITCRWFSELISVDDNWNSGIFTDDAIALPGSFVSLLSAEPAKIRKNFLIREMLKELPFCILKNKD